MTDRVRSREGLTLSCLFFPLEQHPTGMTKEKGNKRG